MQFVSEQNIDDVATQLDASDASEEAQISQLEQEQPHILAFVMHEDHQKILTDDEKMFLVSLTLLVYQTMREVNGAPFSIVPENTLGEMEEANWEKYTEAKGNSFTEKLNPLFENYNQEDLLSLVEDAITMDDETSDEEDPELIRVTREGREVIFIVVKTVIDALDAA